MKIYLLCVVLLSAYQLSVADDEQGYPCPDTDPVVYCPNPNALRCVRFCRNALNKPEPYVCPNTNPPVTCEDRPMACLRYCRQAERDQQNAQK